MSSLLGKGTHALLLLVQLLLSQQGSIITLCRVKESCKYSEFVLSSVCSGRHRVKHFDASFDFYSFIIWISFKTSHSLIVNITMLHEQFINILFAIMIMKYVKF